MKILVVDDHILFRAGLLTVLSHIEGIDEILEASDGIQALTIVENEDIDLALIDYYLPDTTGPILLKKIKDFSPETPIIVMSGAEDPAMIRSAMGAGSSGFLPKSIEHDDLIYAINTVLEGGIYVPTKILNKINNIDLDVTNAQGVDHADLIYMAKLSQQIISTGDWSIRAKIDASKRPEVIEVFNQLLDNMENHYNELREHAFHDSLTGLPNRRLFNDRLDHALYHARRKKKRVALVALDVDKFKQVNDQLGHDKGDDLLKAIADRLKISTREVDTVSRFGGDEFTIILTEVQSISDVKKMVKRMFSTLTEPMHLGAHEFTPSVSLGVALSDGDLDTDALFKKADNMLYEVKRNGRNNFKIHEE
jgi:diguanylate cyclase (GGDEF)-like protein